MKNVGIVLDTKEGEAVVQIVRKGPCSENCQMCGACKTQPLEIKANCSIAVNPGDRVEVYSPDGAVLLGLICLFIFPVLLPIVSYVLFSQLVSDAVSLILSLLVLAICGVIIWLLNRSKRYISATKATVISKIES